LRAVVKKTVTARAADSGADSIPGAGAEARSRAPVVWVLSGQRAGDRAQMLALARALGWPFEEKRLVHNRWVWIPGLLLGASPATLDRRASQTLAPPWPDLVIASGRRSVPVARWIRKRSRGRARLVHVGRPWAPVQLFDLVVTTPQYGLPPAPNVLHNALTLNRADPERLTAAAAAWRDRLADLPRPLVALIVGGDARPYYLDAPAARRLGQQADALAAESGGSLLVTTSKRTRPDAVQALFEAISGPAFRHHWTEGGENPYLAFLGLAETLVVTGDSASMLSEACATGKPVYIFGPPERPDFRLAMTRRLRALAKGGATAQAAAGARAGLLARLYDRLVDLGLVTSTRDMAPFHARLVEQGLAAWLGAPDAPGGAADAPDDLDDLERAARRIRGLFTAEES
jgi:mitochondrial fission protein ELM1